MKNKKYYKDIYDLFGLPTDADKEKIKERTNSMIKKFHPDTADDEISATESQFNTLNEARSILLDEEKREQYDKLGHKRYVKENYDNELGGFVFRGRQSIKDSKQAKGEDVDELIKTNYNTKKDITENRDIIEGRNNVSSKQSSDKSSSEPQEKSLLLFILGIFQNKVVKIVLSGFILISFYILLYTVFNLMTVIFAVLVTVGVLYLPMFRNIFF